MSCYLEPEQHEPISGCDCKSCAIASRDRLRSELLDARSTLFGLVHAQQWTRDSESYVKALDAARQFLGRPALP